MFDIIAYLNSRNVRYWTEGKNVTQGWVNIRCIYEACGDISNHLGIHKKSGNHNCWKCGGKGSFVKLVSMIDQCGIGRAKRIAREFYIGKGQLEYYEDRPSNHSMSLPKEATDELPKPHLRYLRSRGFDPEEIQQRYKIKACYVTGKYRHRIIIPVFLKGYLVNFQALDVTDKAQAHYRTVPNKEAVIRSDRLLYNIDNVGEAVALVEGVTDVWRIGFGAVGVFGSRLTEGKIRLLADSGVQTVYVVYDNDAAERGHEAAKKLKKVIREVEHIRIPEGDPDKYFLENPNDLAELRNLLK